MRARLIIGSSLVVAAGVISAGVVVGCKSGGNTGGTGGTTSATTGNATTGTGSTTTTSTSNVTGTGTTTSATATATTGTNMCSDTSKLFPPTPKPAGSKNTLYCPFSSTTSATSSTTSTGGGGTVNCDPSMDHCCETPQSAMMPSTCTANGTACGAGDVDWVCEDPTECPAANPVCCTNFGAKVLQNMVGGMACPNDFYGSKMTGTQCVATVAACTGAAMPGVVICSADAECTAPQKCIGFTKSGNHVGACM